MNENKKDCGCGKTSQTQGTMKDVKKQGEHVKNVVKENATRAADTVKEKAQHVKDTVKEHMK